MSSTHLQKQLDKNDPAAVALQLQDQLRLLEDNIADVVWTLDGQLQMTYCSRSCVKLLGYAPDEIQRLPLSKLFSKESHAILQKVLDGILNNSANQHQARVLELEHICSDGTSVWAEVRLSGMRDGDSRPSGILGVARDITDRRKADDERNRLESHLMQTQRLEAIGALAGGVAHDFNNILTTILGYTEILLKQIDESSQNYNEINQIRIAAIRSEALVRQLLVFSRKQQIASAVININTTIGDLLKMLHRLIGEDISITTSLAADLWSVKGDPGRIEQIIMNLAVNARDAMPEGGELKITTENIMLGADQTKTMQEAQPGNYVCLTASDSGIGIKNELLDRIFEPFFSTKAESERAGLGLATVYGIVMQHKGWINVYSDPGKGTEFKVYLPAIDVKPRQKTKRKDILQEYYGSGEKVLLVEDDEGICEVVAKTLRDSQYEVVEAACAEDALEVFEKDSDSFSLVLSDVVLPNMNGVELIEALLALRPDIRIILTSGYTDDKSHWDIIRDRGYRFLHKPYTFETLLKNVYMSIKYG
ncbi:ATP-binding protein [Thermodesulfobacteriota bacterium]